jgi:uncharacterized protein (DUF2252 family)
MSQTVIRNGAGKSAATQEAAVPAARPAGGSDRGRGIWHPGPATSHGEVRTVQMRESEGKAARLAVPRTAHGEYAPAPERPDPVDLLEQQSATRVPDLVPIRYGRMIESPFRFLRGAAGLMAADLAAAPNSGLRAQLCGDAHMLNFRLLATAERHLVFDINDFDETLPGPFEWDVKRLATSLVTAARANGFSEGQRRQIVTSTVESYRTEMRRFAGMRHLDVWYAQGDTTRLQQELAKRLRKTDRERFSKSISAARSRDSLQAFDKLTAVTDGRRRINSDPPLLVPVADFLPDTDRHELEGMITGLLDRYAYSLRPEYRHLLSQYRFVDMARKVVGVGSVGTRCWILLLIGRDDADPLLLQVKEAGESVLAEHVGPSTYENQGERVVAGQRLMQAAGDIFLGWERVEGIDGRTRDFYVRQLRDWKGVAVAEEMTRQRMRWFGVVSGATLARAHARSGDRIAIASYLGSGGSFDRALVHFAETYADQNERDHRQLVEAVDTGRVPAATLPEA